MFILVLHGLALQACDPVTDGELCCVAAKNLKVSPSSNTWCTSNPFAILSVVFGEGRAGVLRAMLARFETLSTSKLPPYSNQYQHGCIEN